MFMPRNSLLNLSYLFFIFFQFSTASAEEQLVKSDVVSIDPFKNGLSVVTKEIKLNGTGTYVLDENIEPVHGTFWIHNNSESIFAKFEKRKSKISTSSIDKFDIGSDLIGKQVTIHFALEGLAPVSGIVTPVTKKRSNNWNRNYNLEQPYRYGWQWDNSYRSTPISESHLAIKNDKGVSFISPSQIAYLESSSISPEVERERTVLLFINKKSKDDRKKIKFSYLSKGISWAPSYKVNVESGDTLKISQWSVIKNELEDINNAQINLISGFPSIEFAHVTSPLSLNTSWSNFFKQLSSRKQESHQVASNMAVQSQMVAMTAVSPNALQSSSSPELVDGGVDIHYQSLGSISLKEGSSMSLQIDSSKTKYEKVVEWFIPDNRSEDGRLIDKYRIDREPKKYQDSLWDALKFKNPFDFPMTTAPATIYYKERFAGQQLSHWANPSEEMTMRVTKALSIRALQNEYEVKENKRSETLLMWGDRFRTGHVKATLTLKNYRNENVAMVIRRRFSGNLNKADGEPKTKLIEKGVYSINPRNEVTWNINLKSGEEKNISFTYNVLIRT